MMRRDDTWKWLVAQLPKSGGLDCAIAKGWPELHESGTYVKFTEVGAALFA
jgi:hypothetical protein